MDREMRSSSEGFMIAEYERGCFRASFQSRDLIFVFRPNSSLAEPTVRFSYRTSFTLAQSCPSDREGSTCWKL